ATGVATVTITGTSGGLTSSTPITLSVTVVGNFALSPPPSLSITQGTHVTSTITVTPPNGFATSVSLSASGLTSGVSAAFSPNPTTASSTLTLTATSNATTGTFPITITGVGGGLTHNATVSLTVNAGPNFTISASPGSLNVTQGTTGTSNVTVTPQNGFSGTVSLSASGLP